MTPNRFWMNVLTLTALLLALFSPILTQPVAAQSGSPWEEVVDENGNLRLDNLVDLGETSEEAEWMDFELPFGLEIDLDANYHRYQTPSGNIVVLPSPITLVMMAMNPQESGLTGADSQLSTGAFVAVELLGGLLGNSINWDKVFESNPQYVAPEDFWNAVISGQTDVWGFLAGLDFLTDLAMLSWNDLNLRLGLLLYLNGAGNCAQMPGGCSGVVVGSPPPLTCPVDSVSVQQPTLLIRKTAPSNPLVVGQDPEKRGADLEARATLPPVIYTWYEPVYELRDVCRDPLSGETADCRQSTTSEVSDGKLDSYLVLVECRQHVEHLPEPVTSLQATATLNPASRAWITGQLAGAYYEAYVHQERFSLVPGLASWSGSCSGGACSAAAQIPNVPFADPGVFDLSLRVQTAGASFGGRQITQPRLLTEDGQLRVYVTLTTLIEEQ